jgi:threonine dehydrogenase-like Zn-dependent dehydrogenase
MKALVLTDDHRLVLAQRPVPRIRESTDVVVQVVQTGICGTDRSVLVGKFPAKPGVIMGHETVGTVHEIGAGVMGLSPGDRVVVNPTLYCGLCDNCRMARTNFCVNKRGTEVGIDRDGGFAQYILLPEQFVHRIPKRLSFDQALFIEPIACALNCIDAANLAAGETAVVIGGGPIGAVTAMTAQFYGANVHIVEPDAYRRQYCQNLLNNFGYNGEVHDPDDSALAGIGDVVFDTVGNMLESALASAAVTARVVVMGYNSTAEIRLRPLDILQRGLTIIGAGDYTGRTFLKAIRIVNRVRTDSLISHRVSIDDYSRAFALLAPSADRTYAAMKAVIVI